MRALTVLAGAMAALATGGGEYSAESNARRRASPAHSQAIWQADFQVRGLSVSETKGGLIARVVVMADIGEVMGARVEILLPVGVGVTEMTPGCSAGPNPPGVRALSARVVCRLGDVPSRSSREVRVVTTAPPAGVGRGFGVVALSDTPDPRPGNNFLEKTLP